ncbi:hypothetical protein POTOM_057860 [Populus tomentosa]|uniref:TMV resistance protein N-like n=1 Tax=Populus tomentosa TaxID=118781 RepID=A0A8X7XTH4_POPTO|nr:hypothetical protein POTOM_057860 [Populus tomentosa]
MAINLLKVNDMNVDVNVFCNLQNLRLLQLNHVKLGGGCEFLLRKLTWLCWHGFPLSFIPDGLYGENLVAIDMRHSNLRQVKNSKSKSIETLYLSGCSKFDELPEDLGDLESLTILHADDTAIRQVPSTIVKLKNLKDLSLCGCKGSTSATFPSRLMSWFLPRKSPSPTNLLPPSFHGLNRLTSLLLSDCNLSDDALPRDLGSLPSLTKLELDRNNFQNLPAGLSSLLRLTSLRLDDNTRLQTIPALPRNLDTLHALNCTSLERLSDISVASRIRLLYIANCPKLIEVPGLDKSRSITHIDMEGCYDISNTLKNSMHKGCITGLVLPGNEIPALFNYKNEGASIFFKLPEFDGRNLKGMNVCIVCSSHLEKKQTKSITIKLTNHTKGFTKDSRRVAVNLVKSCEDHLWQGHISNKSFQLDSEDEVKLIVDCRNTMIVKKTGVYLVYEQDEAKLKAKRGLDSDDEAGSSCDNLVLAKRLRIDTSPQIIEENMDVA